MIQTKIATALIIACLSSGFVSPVHAQASQAAKRAFDIPEWKSADGSANLRLRMRAVHDFYHITTDFDGSAPDIDIATDNLRALRIGIDGQLSPKVRMRADANLVNSQVNWADVYLGYIGDRVELYVGQSNLSSPLETVSRSFTGLLPERSLINFALGQNQRNLGAVARVKGEDWQVVGGIFHGNINAGDVFGSDALRYAQIRATHAPRNQERDIIHYGINLRIRDVQDGALLRYATRPAATNFGPRVLDSGAIASQDMVFGFEGGVVRGSLVVTAEHNMLWADTPAGSISLQGSYIEAGYFLTGESRRYRASTGVLSQVRPIRSVQEGGLGAIAVVARYDRLDQSNPLLGTNAGRVNAFSFGVSWVPIEHVTFRVAASESRYTGFLPAQNGVAHVIMSRAQLAF